MTARRLLFNARLRLANRVSGYDLVIGFDIDGVFLDRRGPPPFVLCLKGVAADEARFERGRPRLALRTIAAIEAHNARRADLVVVPSEYSARIASAAYDLPARAIEVVPEGIDLAPWKELRRSPPPRDDPHPTILTVARQYPRKDTRTLLDAMPRVLADIPTARLRVVGGGPELEALRAHADGLGIGRSVEFLGAVADDAEVRREYFRADVFCLPTRQEGFGIVLLEAMAAGVPIVTTTAGAVPEVVRDGRDGLLVPPGQPDALADALLRLLGDAPLARSLAASGLDRVRRFEILAVTGEFLGRVLPRVGAG